jgi:hypothetical protein
MRAILAQVDDDDGLEAVNFDSTDDEQNAIGEHVAASLGDDNLDDLCTVAEDDNMGDMLRKYAGKKEHQAKADTAGAKSASAKVGAQPLHPAYCCRGQPCSHFLLCMYMHTQGKPAHDMQHIHACQPACHAVG